MAEALLALAEHENIDVIWFDFTPPINGLYAQEDNLPPAIFIAKRICNNTPLLRCVIAEELGHHYTTVGDQLPKHYFSGMDRVIASKAEYKALKWAALHLMPYQHLIQAFHKGYHEVWDLADYFDVTEDMITFRLSLLRLKHTNIRSLISRS